MLVGDEYRGDTVGSLSCCMEARENFSPGETGIDKERRRLSLDVQAVPLATASKCDALHCYMYQQPL